MTQQLLSPVPSGTIAPQGSLMFSPVSPSLLLRPAVLQPPPQSSSIAIAILRWVVVIATVAAFTLTRHTLFNTLIGYLDSASTQRRIGCGTSMLDSMVLNVILFHHEIKLFVSLSLAVFVDVFLSILIRWKCSEPTTLTSTPPSSATATGATTSVLSPSSSSSSSSTFSLAGANNNNNNHVASSQSMLFPPPLQSATLRRSSSPDDDDNDDGSGSNHNNGTRSMRGLITPRTITHRAAALVPESGQTRLIVFVVVLLLGGVDLQDAHVRYLSAALTSSSPKWRLSSSNNNNNNNENQQMPVVARNRALECELRTAIALPGLVLVSGARSVGKSITTKKIIANRTGFYCDVHAAGTSDQLEETVSRCIEEYSLYSAIPPSWRSLSLAVRGFLAAYFWKENFHDTLAAAMETLHSARGPHKREFTISDPEFLANRCDENRDSSFSPYSSSSFSSPAAEVPVSLGPPVFCLDGIRDGKGGSSLSLLDLAPKLHSAVQRIAKFSAVVLVAAADETVHDINALPQFCNAISSRVAFVTAAPAEMSEVGVVYDEFQKSLPLGCKPDLHCAQQLLGGAFELTNEFRNLLLPVPNFNQNDDMYQSRMHRFCNAGLQRVVFSAFARTDAASGFNMLSPDIDSILGKRSSFSSGGASSSRGGGGGRGSGGGSRSSSSSSSSFSAPSSASFRLRSLYFMLSLARAGGSVGLPITAIDHDVVETFLRAQLVFEDTLQFPQCIFETQRSGDATSTKRASEGGDGGGNNNNNNKNDSNEHQLVEVDEGGDHAPRLRAVAPVLFNVSLLHIITQKKTRIDEAIQILLDECEVKSQRLARSSPSCANKYSAVPDAADGSFFGLFQAKPRSSHEQAAACAVDDEHQRHHCLREGHFVGKFVHEIRTWIAAHQHHYETEAAMNELARNCGRALQL